MASKPFPTWGRGQLLPSLHYAVGLRAVRRSAVGPHIQGWRGKQAVGGEQSSSCACGGSSDPMQGRGVVTPESSPKPLEGMGCSVDARQLVTGAAHV